MMEYLFHCEFIRLRRWQSKIRLKGAFYDLGSQALNSRRAITSLY